MQTPKSRKLCGERLGSLRMHGNVFELCEDQYGEYPTGDVTDPKGPSSGNFRVLRGGWWNGGARHARSAARSRYYHDDRLNYDGFRVARDPYWLPHN